MNVRLVLLWIVMLIITGPCTILGCGYFVHSAWSLDLGGAIFGAILFGLGFLLCSGVVNKVNEDAKAKELEQEANEAIIEMNERQKNSP